MLDMVAFLHRLVCFYNYESCGQCTPCREGFNWIRILLVDKKQMRGKAENDIIDSIYQSCGAMYSLSGGVCNVLWEMGALYLCVPILKNFVLNLKPTSTKIKNWLRWFHNYKNGKIYPRQ